MKHMNTAQKRIHEAALRLFAAKGASDISVSELAEAAGVARGTIYNNLDAPDRIFQYVAGQLATEMDQRVLITYDHLSDPAQRLAIGLRLYVKRAHDEPQWGRFLLSFGYTSESLRKLWSGPPMQDIVSGQQSGRFKILPDQNEAALGLVAGSTLSAILLVTEGLRTWREAGADAAELVLRALGVPPKQAHAVATVELPPLADI